MLKVMVSLLVLLAIAAISLFFWRGSDHRADRAEWSRLLALQPYDPARFDPTLVAGLPEPARRYFNYTIQPGTRLYTVAEIFMTGRFGLGTKEAPNYIPMRAEQLLAAPEGFIWKMRTRSGMMRVSGSDSGQWTRFWVFGLAPVARAGGEPDHTRSAFGRYVAEALIWTPAALLPRDGVRWEPVNSTTARVTVDHRGLTQSVEVSVDEAGRPVEIQLRRWSNANPEKTFRWQPFGGYLSGFREFDGYRLPTRVEAGNHFGTEDYFPFFIAEVTEVRFPVDTASE